MHDLNDTSCNLSLFFNIGLLNLLNQACGDWFSSYMVVFNWYTKSVWSFKEILGGNSMETSSWTSSWRNALFAYIWYNGWSRFAARDRMTCTELNFATSENIHAIWLCIRVIFQSVQLLASYCTRTFRKINSVVIWLHCLCEFGVPTFLGPTPLIADSTSAA